MRLEFGPLPNKALQLPSAVTVSKQRRIGSLRSPAALAAWRRDIVVYHSRSARSQLSADPLGGMKEKVTVVFALLAALSCTSPDSTSHTTPSDAALGFAVSRSDHGILVRSDSVSHERDPDLAARLEFLCTRQSDCAVPVRVHPSTIKDFNAVQEQTEHISDRRLPGIAVIAPSEFERIVAERAGRDVNTDLPVLIHISPAGFSSDRQQALLFVTESCGSLCGGGWYLLLDRRHGSWSLTHALLDWIS